MPKRIKEGKLLYHITALDNIQSIFENGLHSRSTMPNPEFLKTDVAREDIIGKRRELGILDYVPFHFFVPTPFAGAVFKAHPDKTFCTIAITRNLAQERGFPICTAHPLSLSPKAEVLPYDEGFERIDWEAAERRDYKDETSKNACMAECLATSPVQPEDFCLIFVPDIQIQSVVERLAEETLGRYSFDIAINNWLSRRAKER